MAVDPFENWVALGTSLGYHVIWDMRFQLPIRHWQHGGHSKCESLGTNKAVNRVSYYSLFSFSRCLSSNTKVMNLITVSTSLPPLFSLCSLFFSLPLSLLYSTSPPLPLPPHPFPSSPSPSSNLPSSCSPRVPAKCTPNPSLLPHLSREWEQ